MFKDLSRITDAILEGEYPSGLTLDEQVTVINEAAYVISLTRAESAARREEGRCFVIWIAGLHPDLFLYGAQYLMTFKGITFPFDDKTKVRMEVIADRFNQTTPYEAKNYNEVEHHAWPKEFLDESSFEDRLEALAEEYESEESPADLLLSGMSVPDDLDFNQRMQLTQDAVVQMAETFKKYGSKSNIITDQQLDRFLGWVMGVEEELCVWSARSLFAIYRIQANPANMNNWEEFSTRFKELIVRA